MHDASPAVATSEGCSLDTMDNYQWLHGYDVSFGIIDRNRSVRASGDT